MWLIAAPVILVLGAAANALQLLLLRRRGLWQTSTSSLLTLMSAAHLAVLLTGLMLQWLDSSYGIRPAEWSPGMCRWTVFLRHVSSDVAAWLLVGLVSSAAIPTAIPPKAAVLCSACLTGAACAKNAVLFWMYGPVFDRSGHLVSVCGTPKHFAHFEAIAGPWLFHGLGVLLPSVAVFTVSTLLLLGVGIDGVKQVISVKIAPLWPAAKARLNKLSDNPHLRDNKQTTATKTTSTGNNTNVNSNEIKLLAVYLSASFLCNVGIPSLSLLIFLRPCLCDHAAGTDLATAIVRNIGYAYFASSFLVFCAAGHVDWAEFVALLRRKPSPAQLRAASYRQKMREWLRSESGRRMEFYSVRIVPVNVTEHLTVETISASCKKGSGEDDCGYTAIVLP